MVTYQNIKDGLMYAIIKHSGKQYKVSEGNFLNLDRFEAEKKRHYRGY